MLQLPKNTQQQDEVFRKCAEAGIAKLNAKSLPLNPLQQGWPVSPEVDPVFCYH